MLPGSSFSYNGLKPGDPVDLLYVESLARGGEAVKEQSDLERGGAMLGRGGRLHGEPRRGGRPAGSQDPDIWAFRMPRSASPVYPVRRTVPGSRGHPSVMVPASPR